MAGIRVATGPWKSLNFLSWFSRPGTLKNVWIFSLQTCGHPGVCELLVYLSLDASQFVAFCSVSLLFFCIIYLCIAVYRCQYQCQCMTIAVGFIQPADFLWSLHIFMCHRLSPAKQQCITAELLNVVYIVIINNVLLVTTSYRWQTARRICTMYGVADP